MSRSHRPRGSESRFPTPSLYDLFRNSLARKLRRMAMWSRAGRRRLLQFEPLEPRLLLSADLSYTAAGSGDLTLRVADVGGVSTLQLVDSNDPSIVLASESMSDASGASVDANGFDVTLHIDDSLDDVEGEIVFAGGDGVSALVGPGRASIWDIAGNGVGKVGNVTFTGIDRLIGGAADDTLFGPAPDTVWNVTGDGKGKVAGMEFAGFENLKGAADNEDTFVFEEDGKISGLVDGGADGFDAMVLDGGTFETVVFSATGPQSGTIDRDGSVIR